MPKVLTKLGSFSDHRNLKGLFLGCKTMTFGQLSTFVVANLLASANSDSYISVLSGLAFQTFVEFTFGNQTDLF